MMPLTAVQISELTAQFFLAAAGTLSFAILFACPRRCLPYCALVGAVGWLWYELLTLLGADAATASLLAVIPLTILTRVFAITQKTPVTVFLLTGIFPLLFVPAAAGVMDLWADLQAMLVPVLLALIPITILVMTVSGCVTQRLAERKEKKQ